MRHISCKRCWERGEADVGVEEKLVNGEGDHMRFPGRKGPDERREIKSDAKDGSNHGRARGYVMVRARWVLADTEVLS
jgi:hypothetical protein